MFRKSKNIKLICILLVCVFIFAALRLFLVRNNPQKTNPLSNFDSLTYQQKLESFSKAAMEDPQESWIFLKNKFTKDNQT